MCQGLLTINWAALRCCSDTGPGSVSTWASRNSRRGDRGSRMAPAIPEHGGRDRVPAELDTPSTPQKLRTEAEKYHGIMIFALVLRAAMLLRRWRLE